MNTKWRYYVISIYCLYNVERLGIKNSLKSLSMKLKKKNIEKVFVYVHIKPKPIIGIKNYILLIFCVVKTLYILCIKKI